MKPTKPTLLNLMIVVGCVLSNPLWADDQPADDASRGVARISFLNGDVSVRRGDSGEIVAAAINAPLVAQDSLLTGSGATAEIQFDSANMIRLGQYSEVRLTELAYHRAQMQVANGTVTFRVLRDSDSRMEIDTPQVSVRPTTLGSYRITIREDGTSEVAVRSGEADIFTPRGSEPLRAGQMIDARGTAADPEFQVLAAPALDDWDRWNENRDRRFERTRSYQYVNRDIYGAEDLDDNGDWVDSEYGRAWRPRVAANWAPYRNGHWAWIDYYGWTWVSDDSWGWAPYHYGNWFHDASFGWAWSPGAYDYPHYYWSPALVAFVGFGHGFGGGFGFGNIGWVPLAPFESCHRWWGGDFYSGFGGGYGYGGGFGGYNNTVINNTNIVNNVNITNIYRNARVANGVTAVNAGQFGQNQRNFQQVSPADLRGANLVQGQVPVAPTRQSLQFANRQPNLANLPRTPANRQFSARHSPQQVARVPFEQQRQTMQQVARQTLSRPPISAQAAGISPNGTTLPGGRQANGTGRSQIVPSQQNQRFATGGVGNNGIAQQSPAQQTNRPQAGTGWQRFGETNRPQAPQTSTARVNPNRSASSSQFGGARTQPAAPTSPGGRASDNGGWHRIGELGNGAAQVNRSNVPTMRQNVNPNRPASPSQLGPVTNNGGGQTSSRSGGRFGSSGSQSRVLQVSPPIVRERPAPSYSRVTGGNGGSRTFDSRPAPSYRPTPPNNGGGGYGGSRTYQSRPAPTYHPSQSYNGGGGYRPSPSAAGTGSYPRGGNQGVSAAYQSGSTQSTGRDRGSQPRIMPR